MHLRCVIIFLTCAALCGAASLCDLNGDNQVNIVDVQQGMNQALGSNPCGSGDLNLDGRCDVVDVQLIINSALGQACAATQTPPANGSSVTAYGAKCDGSTDDRAAIQNAFNNRASWASNTLVFPAGQTCIIGSMLTMANKSNWTILGQGATIKAKNGMCLDSGSSPGCTGSGPMLWLVDVDNFTIDNLDMDGNRANRTPFQQGGGHNVVFDHATNGTIRNVDWVNAPTDNAIVRGTNKANLATRSANLTFIDSKFLNAWRDNVSVTYAQNIRFLGTCSGGFTGTCTCQMVGANGQEPETGIDWEPDGNESSPAIDGGLVDGCLLANNRGNGVMTEGKAGAKNVSVVNSIFRGNGGGDGPHNAAIRFTGTNDYASGNWIGVQSEVRWGVLYIQAGTNNIIENNLIDGIPPVGSLSGGRYVIYFGNFGNGSGQFKNNKMTNIHTNASGDWCRPGVAGGGGSTVSGNMVNGVLQNPGVGCP